MLRLASLTLLITCGLAPSAGAAWFPADPVDGPSPAIRAVTGVDLARDGNGAVVYLKDENGVPHVFISRHVAGQWRAPERVDGGIETAATEALVSVADEQRLAVAFISGGRLYGSVVSAGGGPLPGAQLLYADPDPLRAISDLAFDMGINGTAYATFTAPGGGGTDVRAVRLQDTTWEPVTAPLDIDPAHAAGNGKRRSQVAVAADGNGVVVWGEEHPDGRDRVYGRRVTALQPSAAPQEVSIPDLGGEPGGAADSPDISIEDDVSFAWVVWRQDIAGRSRSIARRLVGSLYEAPVSVDNGGPSIAPQIAINGRGIGHAVAQSDVETVVGAPLRNDIFAPGLRIDSLGASSVPVVAVTEKREVGVAWLRSGSELRARHQDEDEPFSAEAVISRPELGPATAPVIAADRFGDIAIAAMQGDFDRRVVVGSFDRPPGTPVGTTTNNWQRRSRPRFRWRAATDLWGAVSYRVLVDGVEIGKTPALELIPAAPVLDGTHTWTVQAVDQRGQAAGSRTRYIRVDSVPPLGRVRIDGKRKAGQTLKFFFSASDDLSGLKYALIDYGDGSPVTYARHSAHRYRRGKFILTLKVADRAGNVERIETQLRIKK